MFAGHSMPCPYESRHAAQGERASALDYWRTVPQQCKAKAAGSEKLSDMPLQLRKMPR
jgi:hypothetical protein